MLLLMSISLVIGGFIKLETITETRILDTLLSMSWLNLVDLIQ